MPVRQAVQGFRLVLAFWLLASLGFPVAARADNSGVGQLVVPGDHHLPGETIEITGYELDPEARLTFALVSPSASIELARATVAQDGTVATSAVVPMSYPLGYAQVVATAADGGQWTTAVLIGERAEGPDAQQNPPGIDAADRLPWMMLGGGLIVLVVAGAWFLRGRGGSGPAVD